MEVTSVSPRTCERGADQRTCPSLPHNRLEKAFISAQSIFLAIRSSLPCPMLQGMSTARAHAAHPPVASARVGRGVLIMVSTTRVSSTGLPTRLHA